MQMKSAIKVIIKLVPNENDCTNGTYAASVFSKKFGVSGSARIGGLVT